MDKNYKKQPMSLSSFVRGGVALLVTANVDMVSSFITSYWATWKNADTKENGGYGLWKIWKCTSLTVSDGVNQSTQQHCSERVADLTFPAWYTTLQVLQSIALVCMMTSLIMLLLYMTVSRCHKNKLLMSLLIAVCYLAGFCIVVSLFVFGFKVTEEIENMNISEWTLSWSLSLNITAVLLSQVAASVLVTENKRLFANKKQTVDDQSDTADLLQTVQSKK